jgi:hypothetical protein
VRFTVARALEGRDRDVKLYEIREKADTFLLQKVWAELDEEMSLWPRRARTLQDAFADLQLERL